MNSSPQLPIQPVERPILCSPYADLTEHWIYDANTGEAQRMTGRRPVLYWFKTEKAFKNQQMELFAEETREDIPLINHLREDIRRWRRSN